MWLEEVTPRQEEEEGYSLLRASLRSHTGSVRLHTTAGIKLMFCCFSAGLFSSFSFPRDFPLHIMARDLHFVSGCRGSAFEETAFISQFCPPCFSVARSQALPYPPPGCGKSRDVMRSRGIDISKQTFWHWATGLASKALLKNCGDLWERLPADKLAHGSQPSWLAEDVGFPCSRWRAQLQLMTDDKENPCKNPACGTVEDNRLFGVSLCFSQKQTWD